MAIENTGSLVRGTVDGMTGGLVGPTGPTITYVNHSPNNMLVGIDQSGLAIDWTNGKVYINKTANGSTWYKLGSVP